VEALFPAESHWKSETSSFSLVEALMNWLKNSG